MNRRPVYREQYAEWDAKTREMRAEMNNILEAVRLDVTKNAIGMFPQEAQEAVFTPPEKRTAMQWQMYHRSASRLPKEAALEKALKGDVKDRYAALKKELAQYDSIKPPDPPVGEVMVDQGRDAPPTHLLAKGVWDAPLDEVQPGFLTILDPNPAKVIPPGRLELQRPAHGARQLAGRPEQSAARPRDGESHLALSFRPGHRRQPERFRRHGRAAHATRNCSIIWRRHSWRTDGASRRCTA